MLKSMPNIGSQIKKFKNCLFLGKPNNVSGPPESMMSPPPPPPPLPQADFYGEMGPPEGYHSASPPSEQYPYSNDQKFSMPYGNNNSPPQNYPQTGQMIGHQGSIGRTGSLYRRSAKPTFSTFVDNHSETSSMSAALINGHMSPDFDRIPSSANNTLDRNFKSHRNP